MEYPMSGNSLLSALVLCTLLLPGMAAAQANPSPAAPQQAATSQAPAIVIGPGDLVNVQVFDTPELSAQGARVSQNGEVSLPVLGIVQIAGLTTDEAARKIEAELRSRGIMLEPHVTVSVIEYATEGATLLGEVKAPGVYPTFGGRRLLDMIAMAGGVATTAGKLVTIAHRDDPQHPESIALVPNAAQLGAQQNPVIQPGDTIMVGRAGIIYILGAVHKPGGFLIDNNEHVSLMQAITLAGGWSQTAGLSKARLIRKIPEGHKELILDLKHVLNGRQSDVTVENGDILYIPVSLGKTLAYRGMEAAIAAAQTSVVYAQAIP